MRLSEEEHHQVQQAATDAHLPVSTLIRLWALDRLHAEHQAAGGTVAKRLERLEQEVFNRSA